MADGGASSACDAWNVAQLHARRRYNRGRSPRMDSLSACLERLSQWRRLPSFE
jgi:hypothetical protein